LFFGGNGVCTQGFTLAKQALYCLSHISSAYSFHNVKMTGESVSGDVKAVEEFSKL
jgi:hypothetical protein